MFAVLLHAGVQLEHPLTQAGADFLYFMVPMTILLRRVFQNGEGTFHEVC